MTDILLTSRFYEFFQYIITSQYNELLALTEVHYVYRSTYGQYFIKTR